MITQKAFILNYQDTLKDFIGLPLCFHFDSEGNLQDIDLLNFDKDLHEVNNENIGGILATVKKVLLNFYEHHHQLQFRPVYKQLLIEELTYCFIDRKYPDKGQSLAIFIEHLKKLCSKTYESNSTEMGFIILKAEGINVKEYLENFNINFIEIDSPQQLEYFMSDKQTLKIIDSKSVSFVINSDYNVIGLAQKSKGGKSIFDIMMTRHRYIEEMDIKLLSHNHYVHSHIPSDTSLVEALTELAKLQNETVELIKKENNIIGEEQDIQKILKSIDMEKYTQEQKNQVNKHVSVYASLMQKEIEIINEQSTVLEQQTESLLYIKRLREEQLLGIESTVIFEMVDFVYFENKQITWSSSYEYIVSYQNGHWKLRNYFVLRSILAKFIISQYSFSSVKYAIEKIDYSIPKVLVLYNLIKALSEKNIGSLISVLKKSNRKKATIFKEMLQKGKLSAEKYKSLITTASNNPLNIKSCDTYLFELIAGIDGAIILDHKLNLISFGEMISSQKQMEGSQIEYRGARTLAALSGSKYGLGLKISEDGDIQIFENFNEIARI